MPVMDGLEATARIMEKGSKTGGNIPIIAITAGAMASNFIYSSFFPEYSPLISENLL